MKKYLLGVFAIALAIGFSSYRPYVNYLTFDPIFLDESNVDDAASYSTGTPSCASGSATPCRVDLDLITSSVVTDESELLSYLATFPTDAARVNEIKRIAAGNFKN